MHSRLSLFFARESSPLLYLYLTLQIRGFAYHRLRHDCLTHLLIDRRFERRVRVMKIESHLNNLCTQPSLDNSISTTICQPSSSLNAHIEEPIEYNHTLHLISP